MNTYSAAELINLCNINLYPTSTPDTIYLEDVIVTQDSIWSLEGDRLWCSYHRVFGEQLPWNLLDGSEQLLEPEFPGRDLFTKSYDELHYLDYYCGWHWGHFVTETLGRCHKLVTEGTDKQVLVNLSNQNLPTFLWDKKVIDDDLHYFAYNDKWLHYAFKERPMVLGSPIFVEKLELATPQWGLKSFIDPQYFETVKVIADRIREPYKGEYQERVYLSRTRFKNSFRKVDGEIELENKLREAGWNIVYPEMHSTPELIGILENCDVLAAVEGSALHNLVFCEKHPEVFVLSLENVSPDCNIDIAMQNVSLNIETTYIGALRYTNNFRVIDKEAYGVKFDTKIHDVDATFTKLQEFT